MSQIEHSEDYDVPVDDRIDQVMSDYQLKVLVKPGENRSSIYNCHTCSLKDYHKPLSLDNIRAPLMVIGHEPSDVMEETKQGKILKSLLEEDFHVDPKLIYYTAALKCKGATDIKACHHHLVSEILYNQPFVIIALGYDVASPFLEEIAQSDEQNPQHILYPGYAAQVNEHSGMIVTNTIQDVMDDEKLQKELIEHFQFAIDALKNREG